MQRVLQLPVKKSHGVPGVSDGHVAMTFAILQIFCSETAMETGIVDILFGAFPRLAKHVNDKPATCPRLT